MIRRLIPASLFGQILLTLILGILVATGVSLGLLLNDRAKLADRLIGDYAIERLAQTINILNQADAPERPRLARLLNDHPTRIELRARWRHPERLADNAQETAITRRLAERLRQALDAPLKLQVLAIARPVETPKPLPEWLALGLPVLDRPIWQHPALARPQITEPIKPVFNFAFVLIQARLSDGSILTLRHALPPPMRWPLQTMGWLLGLGFVVLGIVAFVLRRLTRPLDALARAAAQLPQQLDQPPLPETGPTEVSRAARAFNQMQHDIRQLIDARSQALAGVSHDLRLPITRIRLRLASYPDDERRAKIEDDLSDMDTMIGHTLAYLRAGARTETPVELDLNALLDVLCDDMTLLGARIERLGEARAPLRTRPQAIQRALQNLLENAWRYGDGSLTLVLQDTADQLSIAIGDRGPGIAPADRERVFEPFVRLETSRAKHTGGSGLGLAIARAIIRAEGGDLVLESRDGGGTWARINLPRS
ncbi:ATP-binding protein [Halothiobacillus sp. DCM-1]|uniref:ATP-binding protein n=1 Tax=Halothiobacillus sp. DCM-1 TaxID=3112558 RepID=UPI00324B4434